MMSIESHTIANKFIKIKNDEGEFVRIQAYSDEFIEFEEFNLELAQSNKQYYLFVFSLVNFIERQKKKTYIFVRKSKKYIDGLIQENYDQ